MTSKRTVADNDSCNMSQTADKLLSSSNLKMRIIDLCIAENVDTPFAKSENVYGLQIICKSNEWVPDTVAALLDLLQDIQHLRFVEIVGAVPMFIISAVSWQKHVIKMSFLNCITINEQYLHIPERTCILSIIDCKIDQMPILYPSDVESLRELNVINTDIVSMDNQITLPVLERMVLRNNKLKNVPLWKGPVATFPIQYPARYEICNELQLVQIAADVFLHNAPQEIIITGCPRCVFDPINVSEIKSNVTSVTLSDYNGDFPRILLSMSLNSLTLINCKNMKLTETATPLFGVNELNVANCPSFSSYQLILDMPWEPQMIVVGNCDHKPSTSKQELVEAC